MDLNSYQMKACETACYPNIGENPIYPTLGLTGEAGEVSDKVKKVLRDNDGIFDKDVSNSIMLELGDVLWYVSQLSSELGFELEYVANENLKKLDGRSLRGRISGEGDTR